MALTKKLINAAAPIVFAKSDFETMDEYISQLYDIEKLSLKDIEIHLENVINGEEKVHGRQLDLFGVRQGKRQVQKRERREKDASQMDLFGEAKAYLEERGYQLIKE